MQCGSMKQVGSFFKAKKNCLKFNYKISISFKKKNLLEGWRRLAFTLHSHNSQDRGASVAEWLELLTKNHLPLTAAGSNSVGEFGYFHVRKLSSLRNVGGSSEVTCSCLK